jgi:spore germination cell wall hydrolase CwlJ-like protein
MADNLEQDTDISKDGKLALAFVLTLAGYLVAAAPAAAEIDVGNELECLALTIYFEARGETDVGKLAVGHVVMNRASHPQFPQRVCEVVQQGGEEFRYRCQFTWWCDGQSDQPTEWSAWEKSKALARLIYWDASRDPTAGALWYHADYVRPRWRGRLARAAKIGRHVFYRLVETRSPKSRALTRARP